MTQAGQRPPPYQVIASALREAIRAGKYRPGDQLPSEAALRQRFAHAPMTVRAAVRVLREEGLVYAVQGRGTFVCEQAPGTAPDAPVVVSQLRALAAEVADLSRRLAVFTAAVEERAGEDRRRVG